MFFVLDYLYFLTQIKYLTQPRLLDKLKFHVLLINYNSIVFSVILTCKTSFENDLKRQIH